jgi:hypothetical protein
MVWKVHYFEQLFTTYCALSKQALHTHKSSNVGEYQFADWGILLYLLLEYINLYNLHAQ